MTTVDDAGPARSIYTSGEAERPGIRERLQASRSLVRATRRLMRAAALTAVDPSEVTDSGALVQVQGIIAVDRQPG